MTGTLTANHVESFSADGYLVLPDLIARSTVERVREDSAALLATLLHRMVATTTRIRGSHGGDWNQDGRMC
jgi:hypothetical protein